MGDRVKLDGKTRPRISLVLVYLTTETNGSSLLNTFLLCVGIVSGEIEREREREFLTKKMKFTQ